MTKQTGTENTQLFDGGGNNVPAQGASTKQGHAGRTAVPPPASVQNPSIPPGAPLPPGYLVAEYVIERVLGQGGMGSVYLATHPLIGKRVAIKVLSAAWSTNPELVRRFVDEARAVNKIGHRNIIDIFAFGQLADERQYFIMEYLEGETLAARMERGPIPSEDLQWIVAQACSALEAAHQEQIVHRDLKPENIWLAAPKHAEPFLKILDFGIAKLIGDTESVNATQTGTVMGTPHFMSPEQALGQKIDHRADIYAMGVVLYRLLSGTYPFDGNTYAEIVSKMLTQEAPPLRESDVPSDELRDLVLSCLDKDQAKRPTSARELGRSFARFVAQASSAGHQRSSAVASTTTALPLPNVETQLGFQETPRPSGATDPEIRKSSTRKMVALGFAVLAILVTVGVLMLGKTNQRRVESSPPAQVSPVPSPSPERAAPPAPAASKPVQTPEPAPATQQAPVAEPKAPSQPRPARTKTPNTKPVKEDSKRLIRDNPF